MSFRIQSPPQGAPAAPAAIEDLEAGKPEDTKAKDDTAKVGREFEAIFVRQMLTSTKVAGKSGGYADMAVEALASSITAAGGLGMGRAIEQALGQAGQPVQARLAVVAVYRRPDDVGGVCVQCFILCG